MIKFSYFIMALLITIILVLPFSFNIQFELKSVSRGFILSHILLFCIFKRGNNLNFISNKLFKFFALFSLFLLFGVYYKNFDLLKTLTFIITTLLIMINGFLIGKYIVQNLSKSIQILKIIYIFLLILASIKIYFNMLNIPFIGESSYFSLLFGPISLFATFEKTKYKVINSIVLLYLSLLLPSATILLFLILQISILYNDFDFKIMFISILILLFYFNYETIFQNKYFIGRLTFNLENANLSSLMFMASWSDVFYRIYDFDFFGSGIGSVGSNFHFNNIYSNKASQVYNDIGTTSGTFWFARATQTIGLSCFILFFTLVTKIYQHIKLLKIKTIFSDRYNFLFVILLSTLPEFFFRSSSILSFCILYLFISIGGMYFIRITKNNKYKL